MPPRFGIRCPIITTPAFIMELAGGWSSGAFLPTLTPIGFSVLDTGTIPGCMAATMFITMDTTVIQVVKAGMQGTITQGVAVAHVRTPRRRVTGEAGIPTGLRLTRTGLPVRHGGTGLRPIKTGPARTIAGT